MPKQVNFMLVSKVHSCLHHKAWWTTAVLHAACPTAWNSLSDDLRDPMLSTDSFRYLLKTRLLSEY